MFVVRKALVGTSHSIRHDALDATFAIQTCTSVTASAGEKENPKLIGCTGKDTKGKRRKERDAPCIQACRSLCLLSSGHLNNAFRRAKHCHFWRIMA